MSKSLTLDTMTVLELRMALNGDPQATIAEAIELQRRADADHLERERRDARHRLFMEARAQRRAAAIHAAVDQALAELDREVAQLGDVTGWRKAPPPAASPSRRHEVAQTAAREVGEAFDARWPSLDASAWADAGEPEVYEDRTAVAIVRRAASRVKAAIA